MGFIRGPNSVWKDDDPRDPRRRTVSQASTVGEDTPPRPGPCWWSVTMTPGHGRWPYATNGADPERILTNPARASMSRPGKLRGAPGRASAHVGHHRQSADLVSVDAPRYGQFKRPLPMPIDPIAEATSGSVAIRSPAASSTTNYAVQGGGLGRQGGHGQPLLGTRLRNSTVFEDAADWIVGCASTQMVRPRPRSPAVKRHAARLPTETLIIDLDTDGHGTPSTGGGDDPFTDRAQPVNPLDAKITRATSCAHEGGATQNAVLKAVNGGSPRQALVRPSQGRRHARAGQALAVCHSARTRKASL